MEEDNNNDMAGALTREVIMLKLYNGDYIVGEFNERADLTEEYITLKNPRAFVLMPTMNGKMNAGFQNVCFFNTDSRKSLQFRKEQVMLVVPNADVPKEIENGYKTEITGISMASAQDIAAVNSTKESVAGEIIV